MENYASINQISVQCYSTEVVCSATKSITSGKGVRYEDTEETTEIWLDIKR